MRFICCLFLLLCVAVQVQAQEIGRWSVEQKVATALDSGQECIQVRLKGNEVIFVLLGEGFEKSPLLVDLLVDNYRVGRVALAIAKHEESAFIAKAVLSKKAVRAMMSGKILSIKNTKDGSDRGSYRLNGFRQAMKIISN